MISDQNFKDKINKITNKLKMGLFDEVISDAKILLKKKNHQILYNILSLAFQSKGEYENSIEIIERALKINPNNIHFLNNIGLSFYKKKDFINAEKYFIRVLEIDPTYINTLNNIAVLKKDMELTDESIEYYKKILKLNENILETHYNLASVYQSTGAYDLAINHYKKTLEINPRFTKSDRILSLMTKYDENNKHFQDMKKKKLDLDNDKESLFELHFALGKAYEDIKNYKNAFENYNNANILKKKITNYDINDDTKLFAKIKNIYQNKKHLTNLNHERKLIFILGMPRSGTSLTEQIISSHKNVFGGGEIIYLNDIIQDLFIKNNEVNLKIKSEEIKKAQYEYLSKISVINKKVNNFTDKAPLNFRWIGFILDLFPNSKIIHCKRDPIENCWSIFKNNFDGNLNFSNSLTDLGKYYNLYLDIMNFWKSKYNKKIYDLSYEKLVSNPEYEIKKLIDYCGIGWDPNCLKHHENKKTIKTVSFAQARKPIYTSSIKLSTAYDEYLSDLKLSIKN